MQWDSSEFGGFSSVSPWIKVNPNKDSINVFESLNDPNSIYHYVQKTIKLKKTLSALNDGDYLPIMEKDKKVLAYKRIKGEEEIVVIANFFDKEISRKELKEFENYEVLLCNYEQSGGITLKPYEARVLKK